MFVFALTITRARLKTKYCIGFGLIYGVGRF